MLKIFNTKKVEEKTALYRYLKDRNSGIDPVIYEKAARIIKDVKDQGDRKLFEYTLEFDGVELDAKSLVVTEGMIDLAYEKADPEMIDIIKRAAGNIRTYHEKQLSKGYMYQQGNGSVIGQMIRPLEKVGIYIPGGTAPLISSVLMNAIPAKLAGVGKIIMAVPPKKEGLSKYLLIAAREAGVDEIYTMGGAQAIAALAYGTKTVPAVDKITGPGNAYVAAAKKIVFGVCGIDMIAGPSEICIIADNSSDPGYIAADLLSQAEHDTNASVYLITSDKTLIDKVMDEIENRLLNLERKEIAKKALSDNGYAVLVNDMDEALDIANLIAPEHLELVMDEPDKYVSSVTNAGAVFVGRYTPEAVGDYYAGANHVLPTQGTARFSSPLGVYDFIKRISYIKYSRDDLIEQGEDIIKFAKKEGLGAHAASVATRLGENDDR